MILYFHRYITEFILMKPVLLLSLIFINFYAFGRRQVSKIVKKIPSISIYNLKGDTTNLQSFTKDKITFINFWFVPCGPCFAEMKLLHRLYSKYQNSSEITFLTITLTDSAFARPLIENRNTGTNETYSYFRQISALDTFKLPVFFIKGAIDKMKSFKKDKHGYIGSAVPGNTNVSNFPHRLFSLPYISNFR